MWRGVGGLLRVGSVLGRSGLILKKANLISQESGTRSKRELNYK